MDEKKIKQEIKRLISLSKELTLAEKTRLFEIIPYTSLPELEKIKQLLEARNN